MKTVIGYTLLQYLGLIKRMMNQHVETTMINILGLLFLENHSYVEDTMMMMMLMMITRMMNLITKARLSLTH